MFSLVSGRTSFHGPWFISPADTQHLPTRMFYEKEVFLSSLEETISVGSISGKCCVLPFREYARCEIINFSRYFCRGEIPVTSTFHQRRVIF